MDRKLRDEEYDSKFHKYATSKAVYYKALTIQDQQRKIELLTRMSEGELKFVSVDPGEILPHIESVPLKRNINDQDITVRLLSKTEKNVEFLYKRLMNQFLNDTSVVENTGEYLKSALDDEKNKYECMRYIDIHVKDDDLKKHLKLAIKNKTLNTDPQKVLEEYVNTLRNIESKTKRGIIKHSMLFFEGKENKLDYYINNIDKKHPSTFAMVKQHVATCEKNLARIKKLEDIVESNVGDEQAKADLIEFFSNPYVKRDPMTYYEYGHGSYTIQSLDDFPVFHIVAAIETTDPATMTVSTDPIMNMSTTSHGLKPYSIIELVDKIYGMSIKEYNNYYANFTAVNVNKLYKLLYRKNLLKYIEFNPSNTGIESIINLPYLAKLISPDGGRLDAADFRKLVVAYNDEIDERKMLRTMILEEEKREKEKKEREVKLQVHDEDQEDEDEDEELTFVQRRNREKERAQELKRIQNQEEQRLEGKVSKIINERKRILNNFIHVGRGGIDYIFNRYVEDTTYERNEHLIEFIKRTGVNPLYFEEVTKFITEHISRNKSVDDDKINNMYLKNYPGRFECIDSKTIEEIFQLRGIRIDRTSNRSNQMQSLYDMDPTFQGYIMDNFEEKIVNLSPDDFKHSELKGTELDKKIFRQYYCSLRNFALPVELGNDIDIDSFIYIMCYLRDYGLPADPKLDEPVNKYRLYGRDLISSKLDAVTLEGKAIILKVIGEMFGIERGFLTTKMFLKCLKRGVIGYHGVPDHVNERRDVWNTLSSFQKELMQSVYSDAKLTCNSYAFRANILNYSEGIVKVCSDTNFKEIMKEEGMVVPLISDAKTYLMETLPLYNDVKAEGDAHAAVIEFSNSTDLVEDIISNLHTFSDKFIIEHIIKVDPGHLSRELLVSKAERYLRKELNLVRVLPEEVDESRKEDMFVGGSMPPTQNPFNICFKFTNNEFEDFVFTATEFAAFNKDTSEAQKGFCVSLNKTVKISRVDVPDYVQLDEEYFDDIESLLLVSKKYLENEARKYSNILEMVNRNRALPEEYEDCDLDECVVYGNYKSLIYLINRIAFTKQSLSNASGEDKKIHSTFVSFPIEARKLIIKALVVMFDTGMISRGWDGDRKKYPYPKSATGREDYTSPDKVDEAGRHLGIFNAHRDDLSKLKRETGSTEPVSFLNGLMLKTFQISVDSKEGQNFLIIPGRNIQSLINLVGEGLRGDPASCIRINSTKFCFTAYYYLRLFRSEGELGRFDYWKLEHIS